MPIITAKVSDELLAYIDLVSGGNRSEYLRRCLEAGPGDLEVRVENSYQPAERRKSQTGLPF